NRDGVVVVAARRQTDGEQGDGHRFHRVVLGWWYESPRPRQLSNRHARRAPESDGPPLAMARIRRYRGRSGRRTDTSSTNSLPPCVVISRTIPTPRQYVFRSITSGSSGLQSSVVTHPE